MDTGNEHDGGPVLAIALKDLEDDCWICSNQSSAPQAHTSAKGWRLRNKYTEV